MTYIRKKRGPSIDPCGTPHVTDLNSEKTPEISTACTLPPKYEINQFTAAWLTPRQSLLSLHMTNSYVRTATRTTLKMEANLTQILNFKANFHTEFEPFFKKKIMLTMVDTEHGVYKLIDGINTSKSSGPDGIPGKLLQSLANELAPVLRFIFEQSLLTGDLPVDWTRANVAPIFKKGSKLQAVNYRPVPLTCITCKLFEHIICRHVLDNLEQHEILTDLQHGFRSGRSCETQLITTFQDIAEMYDKKGSQIDIAVLDFSKAFDTVPHDGLLSKLKHYGIDKNIWQWISNF